MSTQHAAGRAVGVAPARGLPPEPLHRSSGFACPELLWPAHPRLPAWLVTQAGGHCRFRLPSFLRSLFWLR